MTSSKIFITDYVKEPGIEKEILGDLLADSLSENIEVLIVWHENIDQVFMDKLPNLKGIVRYGVGYENVDIGYAKKKGIHVCNTPDYGVDEVSDTALTLILNATRAVTRYDVQCRAYRDDWQENINKEIKRTSQTVLGVIGAGRIGGSVLLKAKNLKFQCRFYDPYKERGYEKLIGVGRDDSLDDLLKISDVITFHAPLTEETQGMVNEEFLTKMKEGASFVNTARGKVVEDIDVFYEPLKSGRLASVGLDVLPHEPPKDSKLIEAWRNREEWLDGRIIINPHASYYSQQSYIEMRQKAASNALRIYKGEVPFNIIV